ncbi:Transposase IS4 [Popillia japonica]|uniref:Transposase IS4 n=1 Tax=Popillia japonica TaxID=7064 RepID=A0AAW1MIA3_POPJA
MYTNLYCQQADRQNQNNSSQKEITRDEVYAFIAILLAAGRNRERKLHLSELWTEDELFRQPFFTAVMSRNRFTYIYKSIRFDDRATREQRIIGTKDKLQAIRSTWDKFAAACVNNYYPHENITVDGRLATQRKLSLSRIHQKQTRSLWYQDMDISRFYK